MKRWELLEEYLVYQAKLLHSMDTAGWSDLMKSTTTTLLRERPLQGLTKRGRLAVAMCIVASGRVDLYAPTIFAVLVADWSSHAASISLLQDAVRHSSLIPLRSEADLPAGIPTEWSRAYISSLIEEGAVAAVDGCWRTLEIEGTCRVRVEKIRRELLAIAARCREARDRAAARSVLSAYLASTRLAVFVQDFVAWGCGQLISTAPTLFDTAFPFLEERQLEASRIRAERLRAAHEPTAPHKNEAATSDEALELRHGWGGGERSLPDEIETVTSAAALSSSPSKVVAGSASTRRGYRSQVASTSPGNSTVGHSSSAGDRKEEGDGDAHTSAVWSKYGGDMSKGTGRRQLDLLNFNEDVMKKDLLQRKTCMWRSGAVDRVRGDGTYDIRYENGKVDHAVQRANIFVAGGGDEPATLRKLLEISHRDRGKCDRKTAENDDETECARVLSKKTTKRRRLQKEVVAWPPSPVMDTPHHSALDVGWIAAGTPTRPSFSSEPSRCGGDYASSQSPTIVSSSQSSAMQGLRIKNLSVLRSQPTTNERDCHQASTVGDRETVTEITGIQPPEEDGQTGPTKPDVGHVVEGGSSDAHSPSWLATKRRWPSSPTKMTNQYHHGAERRPGASGANETSPKPGEAASSGIVCSSSRADAAFGDGMSDQCLAVKEDGTDGNLQRGDVNLRELPRQGGPSRTDSRRCEKTEEDSEISEAETVTQEEFCAICQMNSELSDAGSISQENGAGLDEGEQGGPSVSADCPAGDDVPSPRATLSSMTSSIMMLVPRSTECQAPNSLSTACSDGNSSRGAISMPTSNVRPAAHPEDQVAERQGGVVADAALVGRSGNESDDASGADLNGSAVVRDYEGGEAHLSGLVQAMPASEKLTEAREIDKRQITSALPEAEKEKHCAAELYVGAGEGTHLKTVDVVGSPTNIELASRLGVGEGREGGNEEGDGRVIAENVRGKNGCTHVGQAPSRTDHAPDAAANIANGEVFTIDAGVLSCLHDAARRGTANGDEPLDVPAEVGNSGSPTENISQGEEIQQSSSTGSIIGFGETATTTTTSVNKIGAGIRESVEFLWRAFSRRAWNRSQVASCASTDRHP